MLAVNSIEVIYGGVVLVLKGVTFEVKEGSMVALLGANGAGKSTTLKAISGMLRVEAGRVTRGSIELDGTRVDHLGPEDMIRRGVVQVREGRAPFHQLTVEDNLKVGASGAGVTNAKRDLDMVYEFFPALRELRSRTSAYLSGGELQMMVIGRGLMARPKIMLLDEPSLGLAPKLVASIMQSVKSINQQNGTTFLLVEQNARAALDVVDYGYVMEQGRIVLEGSATQLRDNADIKEFYLGLTVVGENKSYRDVKRYKRRKRWAS